MLYMDFKKYRVETPIGKKVGKLRDIVVDIKDMNVKGIEIGKGIFGKVEKYDFGSVKQIDEDEKKMIIEDTPKEISLSGTISLKEIMKKTVYTNDDKEIGKIYDFVVLTKPDYWKIEKILVSWGPTKRRLRLDTNNIKDISDKIHLSLNEEDIVGTME